MENIVVAPTTTGLTVSALLTRENLILGGAAIGIAAASFGLGWFFGKRRDLKVVQTFVETKTAPAPAEEKS